MKTLNKKIAVGLLLGSLCAASIGTAVFANAQDKQSDKSFAMCQDFKGGKGAHQKPHQMIKDTKENLNKLVKDGVISEEQQSKLVSFFKEKGKEMKADMEKMKGMSQEERKAHFKEMRDKHPDFIGEIKNAAGLSDEQSKAVADALRPKHQHRPMMNPEQLTENLSKLVTAGTINQDQADSVVSFFKDKAAKCKEEMDKVHEMSQEERKAYFEQQHKTHGNIINELKSAASLTDDQAKAIADALFKHHGQHGHGPQEQAPKDQSNQ
jgi:lipase chaperone LimK